MGTGKARPARRDDASSTGGEARFLEIFEHLRAILREYEGELEVKKDGPREYYLDTRLRLRGQPLFFGATQIRRSYVSYYLFPVYMFPELLEDLSPALKGRMQGKSCFNFTRVDEPLLDELAHLTRRGFDELRRRPLP